MLMAGILSISLKFDYFVQFLVRQNKVAENSGVEGEGGGQQTFAVPLYMSHSFTNYVN
jgi:hypothetical protein